MSKRKGTAIEKMIEQTYYRLAVGRTIDAMKIGQLFEWAEATYKADPFLNIDGAVQAAIERFCDPVKDKGTEPCEDPGCCGPEERDEPVVKARETCAACGRKVSECRIMPCLAAASSRGETWRTKDYP